MKQKNSGGIIMRSIHPVRLWSVILACLLFSSALAQDDSRTQRPASATAADEAALQSLADALALLKTDAERSALLTAEKELVTEKLVRELIRQGGRLYSQGNTQDALARFRLAQNIAEQIGDKAGMASALNKIGNVHYSQSNYAQALEQYQKSLGMSEALGDKAGIASTLRGIGNVHCSQGNYAQAREHYQKSLALSEALGDKDGSARALNGIGAAQFLQGNYAQALEHYQKSLAVSEALGNKASIAGTLNNIGNVNYVVGNYAQALEYYQKSLTLREALGDKAGIAGALNNIGNVNYAVGNYEQALEHFQKVLAMSEAVADKADIAGTLSNIGAVYRMQGNYAQALEHYQRSLALSQALEDKTVLAGVLQNIAIIYESQGDNDQALEHYQKSLALKEVLGNKGSIALTLGNIGNVYHRQGNHGLAVEYYQRSLTLKEASGDKVGIAMTLSNVGDVHISQGDFTQALELFQRSLTLSETLGDKAAASNTLIDMGVASRLKGNYAQALDFAGRAAVLGKQLGYPDQLRRARNEEGQSYRALNQLTAARQAFDEAIAAVETLRAQVAGGEQDHQRFLEDKLDPYQSMVDLLVAQNESAAALAYAERAKARVLLDVLHSGRVNVTKAMTAAEQERERGFNNHLVSLNTQISRENQRPKPDPGRLNDLKTQLQKARLDYEAFQTSLYAAHPELKTQRGQVEPLTPQQASDLLPDAESALLEYVVTDERTYLFALTRGAAGTATELKVYPLEIKRKELDERAAQFREILAKGSPGFRQPARGLYDLLIKPAAAQLQGRRSLIIVPDGSLWELPFQALQPSAARYLIEDCAIAYAPSLTALGEMIKLRDRRSDSPAGTSTLLAFGNPALGTQTISLAKSVLMDEKLYPLPDAEREVNVIKQIYGPANSRVYVGAEAREERVKAEAGGYRILHLATHGILNDSNPMYSHLVLAQAEGDSKEDGLLEAWEIMKLDLNADLAVLSACETARGRVGAGEGMIGLSWALFVAGCPTSVLSQWKVESASTTELMVEFHRQLKSQMATGSNRISAARALREAALKLQRTNRYRHPFYWAGFVVTGKGF
jgi:CHAT domain-containing protein/Tfp pilus assembly protein PilF